ncbi:MAG: molybdopterin converting factor subunit 1 [Saprospiraceae bacterium]|nr:molybdopterin converting factor subunit 1 [Saprospiraceae bacterium]
MQLTILAFGIAKDILGRRELQLEVPDDTTVRDLKDRLLERYPEFSRLVSLAIAVNSEYSAEDVLLQERDEIALIPPVSGG